ncbi:hypothetical protein Q4530_15155 [Colwellia sp. 1_MG-2023]|uniref:hypothetical protein n=1 Tax=unclassified Colwellia TaxID=196834 RepID=UPI001C09AADA|nr:MULTISPECIES: hypothetical protein [unclassified Colwellia]MBU2923457.1 hypothetical protein [Colwellia sp. C2M11]MDO6653817.1 hypothetical protein [Colwellia sp. 3_MG-2023]MDO6666671.1 hypothetical protein [Colwellia sp. 2_MG-2023]MDO6691112.1 hypothetical protein [Colwellia sp. 1_MG-2023]
MIFNRKIIALAVASVLASCAAPPVDNTPKNPTSVITAKFSINGLYLPDHAGKQTVYTREDMRAIHQKAEFDSFYMGWANYDTTNIFRMTENLLWEVDNDRETYRECKLSGCTDLFENFMAKTQASSEEEEEYETYEERGCAVTLDKNDFTVVATNSTRQIGGLPAQEYTATWVTEFKDSAGKVDLNLLQFVFWTTTPTAEMTHAWKVHEKATDNYLDTVGDNNALVRLLGKDGYKAISAFSGDVEKTDKMQFNSITQKLSTIEGYPLSVKMEWFQKSEACPVAKKKRADKPLDFSQGLGNAASSFLGNIIKDEADKIVDGVVDEWKKDARVRYIYEVTSVSEKQIHDSQFNIPHGYTIDDRQ